MGKQQSGFTLIELIAVIVILGILAATAVPRFVNLQDEAQTAALLGIAGSVESASALNSAIDIATEAGLTTDGFYTVDNCDDGSDLLMGGQLPGYVNGGASDAYTIISASVTAGLTAECTLEHNPSGSTTTFTIIGADGGTL